MNKKGFTLIEILMVLVILVAITVAGTFGIQSIQKKSEEQALNELYSEILLAADVYLNENESFATDLLNKEVDEKCIRIYTLQNEGLLSTSLTNPVTKKLIPGNLCVISYLSEDGTIKNSFNEEDNKKDGNWFVLLKKAPKVFWEVSLVQLFCWFSFQYLSTYATGAIAANVWKAFDPASVGYQLAGNWFGVLTAVQSIAAVIWSYILAKVPNDHHKLGYGISLLLGAVGYGSIFFIQSQNLLILSFILIGISWAAMNTYPLTLVSNALSGKHMGTYLGLFNCSICLPQIIASLLSFVLFPLLKCSMPAMMLTAGISGVLGAISVLFIKETYGN